ncbi:MAG: magnesium/cobalt transporter CorA [Pseudobdellovibrionaceae bacterium]|nr:magnesium/cobalt transporter CorA [Pseudobdellovibrionaceae bacterium]
MLRFFRISNGLIESLDAHMVPTSAELDTVHWIDAQEPTDEERLFLQDFLRTELPQSDDVEEIEVSARCFIDQAGVHVHSRFLTKTETRYSTISVACILQQQRLITIREHDLADFRLLRMRARKGQMECHSPADLLLTLLEQKVGNLADILEDNHRLLEKVSFIVLEEENSDLETCISELARLEDSNGKIRLCLMDTQLDVSFLKRYMKNKPELQETCRELGRDLDTLMSHTTFLFEKINFLMDSTQGFINIKQNQIIKIFSIAAVVFLPPTLIASIYGMNFHMIPELKWTLGYPWAIGLMILSAIAPYLLFKHKGWL